MGWAAGRCRGLGPRWALPSQSATRLSAVTTFVYAPVLENSPWPLQISAVNYRPTIIERAFILAASGRVGSVDEIRQALKNEGYVEGGHNGTPASLSRIGEKEGAEHRAPSGLFTPPLFLECPRTFSVIRHGPPIRNSYPTPR